MAHFFTVSLIIAILTGSCVGKFLQVDDVVASWSISNEDPVAEPTLPVRWALIVAGSSGYYNYRHQADACHAYQIVRKHGIPDENIVVMMYDDIAFSDENPTPGIIVNHPNGSDVYRGVPKDYTKQTVTPENFLKILSGDAKAMKNIGSGKVIASGPNDRIFVNFVDHGAPGIIGFPNGELKASDLMDTVKQMYKDRKYAQLVFYIEACESGSMFDMILPNNINVYATTASNPTESSYACYYDQYRNTYLGDLYSVNWMEDSDMMNLDTEKLHAQFLAVRAKTNLSHVMEYGDLKMGDEVVGEFQGVYDGFDHSSVRPVMMPTVPQNAVPSGDVRKSVVEMKLAKSTNNDDRNKLIKEYEQIMKNRAEIEITMKQIVSAVTLNSYQSRRILRERHQLTDFECYYPAMQDFSDQCFKLSENEYALRHLYALVNLCEEKLDPVAIRQTITNICGALRL